jgi:hypothetical protein
LLLNLQSEALEVLGKKKNLRLLGSPVKRKLQAKNYIAQ